MNDIFKYKLDGIRLENFMGFRDTGWIDLKPITLLFGKNSAGKSAIIRALLLLKQSLNAHDPESPLVFSGDFTNLGNFKNSVWGHNTDLDIGLSFRVSRPRTAPRPTSPEISISSKKANSEFKENLENYEEYLDELERTRFALTKADRADVEHSQLDLSLRYGLLPGEKRISLKSFGVFGYHKNASQKLVPIKIFGMDYDPDERKWIPGSDTPLLMNFGDKLWESANAELVFGFLPVLKVLNQADLRRDDTPLDWEIAQSSLQFFIENIRARFENFVHLPALREQPKRYYTDNTKWVMSLFDLNEQSERAIDQWLKESLINTKVSIQNFDENESIYSVQLMERNSSFQSNLLDTGVGISQALPIILSSLKAEANGLVLVEQPELHLHPEAQAALADLFVDLASKGTFFIIETHSEHFLLRLQRRLAETHLENLKPDATKARNENHCLYTNQITINFITRQNITSSVEHIYLDKAARLYSENQEGVDADTSNEFNAFFRTDYMDARLLGRAMSEILTEEK